MSAWIIISVAAAAFQTLRFMLQKRLSMGSLSAGGATFARFAYSAPIVTVIALSYSRLQIGGRPQLSPAFWTYALIGGLAQILATWSVVLLFAQRNFAVGVTFKKTEVVLTAIAGLLVLGDRVSGMGMAAILLGLIGVLVLSDNVGGGKGPGRFANKAAGLGLLSGVFFAVSAVTYRGATLEIDTADPFLRAIVALSMVTLSQTAAMAIWLRLREPGEIQRVWQARKTALWIGVTGLLGSACWFTAFALQNAAYVFAVGQVEVIFSILASVLFFHETITRREFLGIILLSLSILALVLTH